MDLNKHAPRPPKASITQAIWDELHALEGAKVPQLMKYMPAALMKKKRITRASVVRCLDYGQRWGYFVHDPATDTWKIAPISYWQSREPYRRERRAQWRKAKTKAQGKTVAHDLKWDPVPIQGQPDWVWIALGTTLFWLVVIGLFGLGYLAG